MSRLRTQLDQYLVIRRALGFKLCRAELLLVQFVTYLEAVGTETITTENAVVWASLPHAGSTAWWGHRLLVVRGFAAYLHAIDPAQEVPPAGLISAKAPRATPYLYSEADIAALMAAARGFRSVLRAATFETLVGLLAVSGMFSGGQLCSRR